VNFLNDGEGGKKGSVKFKDGDDMLGMIDAHDISGGSGVEGRAFVFLVDVAVVERRRGKAKRRNRRDVTRGEDKKCSAPKKHLAPHYLACVLFNQSEGTNGNYSRKTPKGR
jgi:hypothetical protein